MVDITKKILNDLAAEYGNAADNPIGANPDLTTWIVRKAGQSRKAELTSATTDVTTPLYDGTDLTPDVRTYLNEVPD